ncbi:MAG: hypothetical protein K0S38_948 [Candidatus Paceibacter sp.]|jgi:hypothetical protein|nr:hypothetical protein [Candidatus Paceibacter sp.]
MDSENLDPQEQAQLQLNVAELIRDIGNQSGYTVLAIETITGGEDTVHEAVEQGLIKILDAKPDKITVKLTYRGLTDYWDAVGDTPIITVYMDPIPEV